MSYIPTNWQRGDTITAEGLNNIESGVLNATHDAQISVPTLIDVPLEAQPDVTFSFTLVNPADPSQTMTYTLVKISDEILTEDDVIGGVIGDGVHSETVTADMVSDLSEMEQYGVTGLTGINVTGMVFCISEASELVPSAGVYVLDMLIPQLDELSFQRVEYTSVTVYPMPMYYGTDEMEDGVTALPTGVVYLQIEPIEDEDEGNLIVTPEPEAPIPLQPEVG